MSNKKTYFFKIELYYVKPLINNKWHQKRAYYVEKYLKDIKEIFFEYEEKDIPKAFKNISRSTNLVLPSSELGVPEYSSKDILKITKNISKEEFNEGEVITIEIPNIGTASGIVMESSENYYIIDFNYLLSGLFFAGKVTPQQSIE